MLARMSSSSVSRSMLRQAGELAQLHVEDVVGLDLGELERLDHQAGACGGDVVARPDQGDDLVDDVERLDATFEDVFSPLGLGQAELRCGG